MIDPVEAVIAYLQGNADMRDLIGDQISHKHQFGEAGWTLGTKALTVAWDGGAPDLYTETQMPRLELRCWGENQFECGRIYRQLVTLSRTAVRKSVQTSDGVALIHYLVMSSAPTFIRDLDIDMDALVVFMQASVAEQSIG